ncbi:MAG TPA: carbohydrate ABC transporter permease [Armatimonadetes bacterium]|nr:carbohydrate ABC transporter permease [Armatimonadota bacterium]
MPVPSDRGEEQTVNGGRRRPCWQTALLHLALIGLSLVFLSPLFWLLSSSFKTDEQIFEVPPRWLPHPPTLRNYPEGLTFIPFWRYLANTLTICVLVVLGTLLSCSLVAYSLARLRWRGRDVLFYLLLGTMMLPFQVTMVPLFVVFAKLRWVDTFLPLTVPAFFGNAFFIFLMRQFFLTIPQELLDAARIDGCSDLDIYRRVVLPLSKPVLATVGLFAFLGAWNDYLGPLIYLSDEMKYTLSLGLATFSSQYGSYPGRLMAVSTVMTLPIIVLFFFTQRTFIQGLTTSGLKG